MNDKKKLYKFSNGLEVSQEELTLAQDYALMDILNGTEPEKNSDYENKTVGELINLLSKNRLVEKALAVIFNISAESDEFTKLSELKNSELQEVVTDFFILNPLALDAVKIFATAAVSQNTNSVSSTTEDI